MSDNVYSTDGFLTTIVSPLTDQRKKIFSMDCEMASSHNNIHICVMLIVLRSAHTMGLVPATSPCNKLQELVASFELATSPCD